MFSVLHTFSQVHILNLAKTYKFKYFEPQPFARKSSLKTSNKWRLSFDA